MKSDKNNLYDEIEAYLDEKYNIFFCSNDNNNNLNYVFKIPDLVKECKKNHPTAKILALYKCKICGSNCYMNIVIIYKEENVKK